MSELMTTASEEALLLAVETHETLFDTLDEMLTSENYMKVLMAIEEEQIRKETAEEAGVSTGTVSNACTELIQLGLVEETGDGYRRTLPVLGHPVIQHIFWEEWVEDE